MKAFLIMGHGLLLLSDSDVHIFFILFCYLLKIKYTKGKNMRYLVVLTIITALTFTFLEAFSQSQEGPVTPYGGSCASCGRYGICKAMINTEDAEKAMKDYYNKKGLNIKIENKKGRFIRAIVQEKGKVVDVIIFDRNTGRIRSIY